MSVAVQHQQTMWTQAQLEALPEDGYIHEVAKRIGIDSDRAF